ncbi:hypothetical protein SMICM17S_03046 [Streptomyces microflavus]
MMAGCRPCGAADGGAGRWPPDDDTAWPARALRSAWPPGSTSQGDRVDDELRTSDPYIHAGDVPSTPTPTGWPARRCRPTSWPSPGAPARTRAPGLDPAGAPGEGRPPGDDGPARPMPPGATYRTVVVREGRLAGGVLLGDLGAVSGLARTWQDDEPLPPAMSLLHLLIDDGGH